MTEHTQTNGHDARQRDDWRLTDALRYAHGRSDPFAAAIRATRMAMAITDPSLPDNPIVFANEAFQRLTGYDREEAILGRNCRFLQGPSTDRAAVRRVHDAIARGESVEIDLLNYRKDGSTFWNALYLSPVRDRDNEIKFFFASQLDVTERVEAHTYVSKQKEMVDREVRARTAELEAALEAKTMLLHEVDHRVKNNLSMIGSLLRLQSRTIDDAEVSSKLESMLTRIDALATVHRRLYESEDIGSFDISEFAATLATDLVGASGRENIDLVLDVERVTVAARRAAPLGLVLNRILTNAIKHGFADNRSGKLSISIRANEGDATIAIADDGPGLASEARNSGLGRTLISRLSRQIGARTNWTDARPRGAAVTITLPSGK